MIKLYRRLIVDKATVICILNSHWYAMLVEGKTAVNAFMNLELLTTGFPVKSKSVKFIFWKTSLTSQGFTSLFPARTWLIKWLDKLDGNNTRQVSTGWAPISLKEMLSILRSGSNAKGASAVKLKIWLWLMFKFSSNWRASNPENKD